MNKHINLVGFLYLVWGAMGALALLAQLFLFLFGSSVLAFEDGQAGMVFGTIGLVVIIFAAIASIPNLFIGWGLIKHRSWARMATFIWSALNLFAFPFGTLLGGYALWVMLQPDTSQILSRDSADYIRPSMTGHRTA